MHACTCIPGAGTHQQIAAAHARAKLSAGLHGFSTRCGTTGTCHQQLYLPFTAAGPCQMKQDGRSSQSLLLASTSQHGQCHTPHLRRCGRHMRHSHSEHQTRIHQRTHSTYACRLLLQQHNIQAMQLQWHLLTVCPMRSPPSLLLRCIMYRYS